jgi:hypothetical protein
MRQIRGAAEEKDGKQPTELPIFPFQKASSSNTRENLFNISPDQRFLW